MAFKAVPKFMPQGDMAGDWARHDGAFGFEDVPNGASHGGREVRLLRSHAFELRAKLCHVFTHFPMYAYLIHDPVVVRHWAEGHKFQAGHLVS